MATHTKSGVILDIETAGPASLINFKDPAKWNFFDKLTFSWMFKLINVASFYCTCALHIARPPFPLALIIISDKTLHCLKV